MSHPSFILDKPNGSTPTTVFLLMGTSTGRLKYSTGEKVLPSCWSGQRMTGTYRPGNTALNRLQQRCEVALHDRKVNGTPITKNALRAALDLTMGRTRTSSEASDFHHAVATIIAERESGEELTPEGKVFAAKTIREYRHTVDYLVKFEAFTGTSLEMQSTTLDTYNSLVLYFSRDCNHAINTVGKHIKNYGVFLRAAYDRGWHTNRVFEHDDFIVPSEETPDIFLSESELSSLAAIHVVGVELLARDWFLIEAFTGLRVSDVKRLTSTNLKDNRITISNEKTDDKVVLPIHRLLKAVFLRWDGMPPPLSEQKINKHIKVVAKDAGITEQFLYTVTKGGKRVDTYFKKWEMVSNHTGRRAFITNLIRQRVPETIIMKLAGIKKHSTLQRYNKLSAEETADVAAELPFFR